MALVMQLLIYMTVQVTIKNVYGNELIYPANETANKFAQLLKKKTFNRKDLKIIESLGYKIELINAYTLTKENL